MRRAPSYHTWDTGPVTQHSSASGIYDGFEGYRTPSREQLATVMSSGLVALDTNVLLDLYRYGEEARDEFLTVLRRLADSLFIPNQVMAEFWRNRVSVLEEVSASGAEVELKKVRASALALVDRWRARTRATAEAEACTRLLDSAFDDVGRKMANVGGRLDSVAAIRDVARDPIVSELQDILDGKVGPSFDGTQKDALVAAGLERFRSMTPPGYRDAEKHGQTEEGTGDYLLWEQLVQRAASSRLDLLLVTRDGKDDWWRVDKSHNLLGPRVELVDELHGRGGGTLLMLRPDDLLRLAVELLEIAVSNSTIEDASRISTLSESSLDDTWSAKATHLLLSRLESNGALVQARAIREASQSSDGFVSRERIFDIGGYDESRHLKGFTRPVKGAVEDLIEEGVLSEDIEAALTAVYSGPGKAEGFRVPDSIASSIEGFDQPHDPNIGETPVNGE